MIARTRCRLGLKRRFVATIEWLRLWPKPGFFPQIAQTFDMRLRSVADACGLSGGGCPEVAEEVGHLERGPGRLGTLVEPRLRLIRALERQDAERHRHARLERRELEPACGL